MLVLELGANDGLRGLPMADMRRNLQRMIDLAQARKAKVLLVGMALPPNYGPRYGAEFRAVYDDLAAATAWPTCRCWSRASPATSAPSSRRPASPRGEAGHHDAHGQGKTASEIMQQSH
ncbi:Esterase TesA precursor [Chromobacterium violaceum]|uniref:Esterase TesA n=1 Tax=Chromobacterium violaceum TaxID=536 RepID=A0A447TJB2_CHRVL|nr:Esterase TesA precursor [Chromobacterium violaceum]